jgi:transposase
MWIPGASHSGGSDDQFSSQDRREPEHPGAERGCVSASRKHYELVRAMVAPLAAGSVPPAVRRPAPHIRDRNCSAVIVFMARTSTPWRQLPAQELGCGSPATVWRRLPHSTLDDVAEMTVDVANRILVLVCVDRLRSRGQ